MPSEKLAIFVLCLKFLGPASQFASVKAAGGSTNGRDGVIIPNPTGSVTTGSNDPNNPNPNGSVTTGSSDPNNPNGNGTTGYNNPNNTNPNGSYGSGVSTMSNSSLPGNTANQIKWDLSMDPCGTSGAMALTPELWASERIDEYMEYKRELRNYTISEYATSLGMPNFYPGIGFPVQAGQICYPAIGRDYMVMYSIEKWNTFMNSMYTAVETTTLMLMDVSAGIVADFIPPGIGSDGSVIGWAIATVVVGIIGLFTGPLAPIVYQAGVGAKAGQSISDAVKMTGAIAKGTQAQRKAYVTGRAAAQAGNMAKVEAAMKAGEIDTLRGMLYNGKGLVANSEKYPDFIISPGKMAKINRMLGYSENTPRPVINKAPGSGTNGAQATENVAQPATLPGANPTARMRRRNKRSYQMEVDPVFEQELQRRSHHHMKRAIPNVYTYTRWSFLCTHLARLRNQIQAFISMSVSITVEAPIWSQQGIAPQIYGGAMLVSNPSYTDLEMRHKKLGIIAIISELFVSLDYIGVIGVTTCKGPGPLPIDGDRGPLAECDDKGVSWSIVRIKEKDNYDAWVHKPKILKEKYGYGTMDLVKRAWDCQKQYGVYGNNTAPTLVDANSPCAFQLPTCDFTNEEFKKKFNKKHPLAACRDVFQLPI
ncbi:hypothetical protein DFH28DRAFT_977792 [Melampsora americana]|nr:hypothetical protein DFH28DRAFT_977792 [Melampsora americana]